MEWEVLKKLVILSEAQAESKDLRTDFCTALNEVPGSFDSLCSLRMTAFFIMHRFLLLKFVTMQGVWDAAPYDISFLFPLFQQSFSALAAFQLCLGSLRRFNEALELCGQHPADVFVAA